MKHLSRKILAVVLALLTVSSLMTAAMAASTDTLKITATPEEGNVTISRNAPTNFSVVPKLTDTKGNDVTNDYAITYMWLLDGMTVSERSTYTLPKNAVISEDSFLLCTVTAVHATDHTRKTGYVAWYPTDDLIKDIYLTISDKAGTFYFDSTDTQTGTSVFGEICEVLGLSQRDDLSKYQVSFVPNTSPVATFEGVPTTSLDKLGKTGLIIAAPGTWITEYFVTLNGVEVLTGKLTIAVEQRVGTDAFYQAKLGESVVIPADEFYAFWAANNDGFSTLDSIFITGYTGLNGILCYDHKANEKQHTIATGLFLYADPVSAVQKPVADLTFIPTKMGTKYPEGTVTVNFIANGKDKNNNMVALTGSFMIFYSSNGIEDIAYDCSGTHVMLSTEDFTTVYRKVTGSTVKNPVYSVRFLDLPKYGALYRGYNANGFGSVGSTVINQNNIDTLVFSSISNAENSLDQLAYVPVSNTSTGDTVRYLVYSGTKVLYVGTLTFTSKEVVVTYTTAVDTAVNFASADFFTAGSPLLQAQFLVFGNPATGALYKDYANGVRVQTSDYFSYNANYGVNLLDNITFVPKEGYAGVVEIPFSGTSLTGGSVNGKVRIYVVRNDVFTDVAADNWAAPYINRLYATGIISGTSATTFSPDANMTYGQALKMILLAAGCPKQSETGGTHWASKYLDYAYKNGFVSSNKIDLDAPINRDAVAELAAKVLGLGKAASLELGVVGPVDSTNGYVWALYNAGILNGSFDADGNNRYYGTQPITRAQVAKIICKINDYVG